MKPHTCSALLRRVLNRLAFCMFTYDFTIPDVTENISYPLAATDTQIGKEYYMFGKIMRIYLKDVSIAKTHYLTHVHSVKFKYVIMIPR